MQDAIATVATELGIEPRQVEAVSALLARDSTVPFIARYRKEATGSLDEVKIAAIRDRMKQLADLQKRRDSILSSLKDRGLLTPELAAAVAAAPTMSALEDAFLPYRPKRRTRGTVARERGLEGLAAAIRPQPPALDVVAEAQRFVDPAKGIASAEDALAGARDIIAEDLSEDAGIRAALRERFAREGTVASAVVAGKAESGAKYRDYFDWRERLVSVPSHRLLAVLRGEREKVLSVSVRPDEGAAVAWLVARVVQGTSSAADQVRGACEDAYRRLLAPSLENETRAAAKRRADEEAIRVFALNVRELLMAPPLGQKPVVAVDPGLRTGCKVVALGPQGELLEDAVVFPGQSDAKRQEAGECVRSMVARHHAEAVAIGNGTAGRETEAFVRSLGLEASVVVTLVNESGASVYSASKVAREEFPDKDVTVRGAVSIGRRLADPLAELVKIDPKAIGVGQYQHDVDQGLLKHGLDDTVVSCVNAVGVEVNTASVQLLTYVSGLGPARAAAIVSHRAEHGPFASRNDLRAVKRLGPKGFEQSAGFLRIRGGANPLDASAVHPESYGIVARMAADAGATVADLIASSEARARIDLNRYATDAVGMPTLRDILDELARPGRDPRHTFEAFAFAEGVTTVDDLKPGMKLPGIVTNVTNFGAFVDVGVHHDGLVHVSELADGRVTSPDSVVKVQQRVTVTVLAVDKERSRISLSMRAAPGAKRERPAAAHKPSRPARGADAKAGEGGRAKAGESAGAGADGSRKGTAEQRSGPAGAGERRARPPRGPRPSRPSPATSAPAATSATAGAPATPAAPESSGTPAGPQVPPVGRTRPITFERAQEASQFNWFEDAMRRAQGKRRE